ncbi:DUF4169 family protein [Phyllobacterium leguminum]|uniref:Uncharacterized protein DUF4169 n=1 Tax=Phyllobacterium leguminum TaxID=314237 RepID=A0A318T569_9HYPH|nr:DUF4169 family protein [Phyllobacterium leguminum]PYE90129.1 uncharacterized protein DUF4169 [Phyllobacterium leguminum]
MNDIVNLRQFKKRKKRDEKEQAAVENRIRHGRTGVEKKFEREKALKTSEFLERNRLDPPPSPETGDDGA